jgi:hypothetical protein
MHDKNIKDFGVRTKTQKLRNNAELLDKVDNAMYAVAQHSLAQNRMSLNVVQGTLKRDVTFDYSLAYRL